MIGAQYLKLLLIIWIDGTEIFHRIKKDNLFQLWHDFQSFVVGFFSSFFRLFLIPFSIQNHYKRRMSTLSAFCGFCLIRISILNSGFAFCHSLPSLWYENISIKIGLRLLWCDTKSKSKRHNLIVVSTLCMWISCLI